MTSKAERYAQLTTHYLASRLLDSLVPPTDRIYAVRLIVRTRLALELNAAKADVRRSTFAA